MARYFWIECGLRGAYADGNGYIAKCDTRRELKAMLQWEADSIRDAGGVGLSKRAIAWLAAKAWKPEHGLPYVVPYRWQYQDSYPYGIHVSQSDRKSYLDCIKQEGI